MSPEPVSWDDLAPAKGEIGGSRHYQGAGIGSIGLWKCPRCLGENTGPLEQGCQVCGSGRPGVHVGEETPTPALPTPVKPSNLKTPFEAWYATLGYVDPDAIRYEMEKAFNAGWEAALRMKSTAFLELQSLRDLPAAVSQSQVQLPFPVEGKVARTLAAALAIFLDQVLASASEEIENGEFCSLQEAEAVLEQLKKEGQTSYE